jgi:hypothetical protein
LLTSLMYMYHPIPDFPSIALPFAFARRYAKQNKLFI